MIIDFHTHYYPASYLHALRTARGDARVETDRYGQPVIAYRGYTYGPVTEAMSRIDLQLEAMSAHGVDRQVLSLSIPGVDFVAAAEQAAVARTINDEFGQLVRDHPEQLVALACLPLKDGAAAAAELERAVRQQGLRGGALFTNLEGRRIDEPHFWPVYERAQALGVPLFVHPSGPPLREELAPYRLAAMLGFMEEISLTIVRLVYGGVLERFPQLDLVFTHLGGSVPYVYDRIQRWQKFPECREQIQAPPEHSLRRLYFDTASFYVPALLCAHAFAGPQHLLLGSDFPFPGGDLPRALATLHDAPLPEADKALIRGGNARRLLGV